MSIVLNGQIGLQQSRARLALAGKYFIVTNPTPGTAIVHATLTGFSATANGLFLVQNTNPASSGINIYLDRLKLKQTATAPTGTLVKNFEVYNESGIVTGTGNVATRTPVNVNPSKPNTTGAVVQSFAAGAITIPAAVGTRRLVGLGHMNTGVTVIHDTFVIDFGGDATSSGTAGLTAARATASARMVTDLPPVIIPPQTTSWLNCWWVTQAANVPSYEFELSYVESAE